MHAASQLPERGPTDVDVALYLHVNGKYDDDDDDDKSYQVYPVPLMYQFVQNCNDCHSFRNFLHNTG